MWFLRLKEQAFILEAQPAFYGRQASLKTGRASSRQYQSVIAKLGAFMHYAVDNFPIGSLASLTELLLQRLVVKAQVSDQLFLHGRFSFSSFASNCAVRRHPTAILSFNCVISHRICRSPTVLCNLRSDFRLPERKRNQLFGGLFRLHGKTSSCLRIYFAKIFNV